MTNNQIARMLIVVVGIAVGILFVLIAILVYLNFFAKLQKEKKTENKKEKRKTKVQELYNIQSILDFMEFDKIEDNMIVQKNGKRYIMVIKCQGINYDLMSNVEKTSVEQGFIQYLNALRYPIQIYIQTRRVNLTGSINKYKERIKILEDNLAEKEFEYNQKVRSENYDEVDLSKDKFEIAKAKNLYEYGVDILNNTEKMNLNKNILSKQYYLILSYYPEEANNDIYSIDEVRNMAFSELYTRAQSNISLLSASGIQCKILDSLELADLLYSAYNREEAETYDLKRTIESGYDNMYITSQNVLDKRMKALDKQIEIDAIAKANEAMAKAKEDLEKEREIRKREKEYARIVKEMARKIIERNENVIGKETAEKAKKEITKENENENDKNEEDITNDQNKQKKVRRAGRPKKTA